jgi:deazaflavin-dependent oxidoreductase (nitroreductase family)
MSDWNTNVIDEFHANEGRVGGYFAGAPMILIHHVKANPRFEVEVGTETFTVEAEELSPEERAKVWPQIVSERPGFGDYEQKTTRVMPVFRLRRR